MDNIIIYGSVTKIPLYNCSAHTPEEWSKLDGVRRPIFGTLDLAYGIVVNLLYIPIVCVMFKKDHFNLSCFKIMIFLGIIDMLALSVNSIITGFLAVEGAVYCTYPTFIYCAGMIGLSLWCCSCILALTLVLNRILDLSSRRLCRLFFAGHRTYLVLTIPIIYFLYFMFFTTPIAFTSKYMTWFFDPLIFPNMTFVYTNIPHTINNLFIVAVTCSLYIYFYISFRTRTNDIRLRKSHSQLLSVNIFFQSALICIVNQLAAIIYVVMNFIDVPWWLIILGHIFWQMGHGAPVFIYLSLNRTIRKDFLKLLGCAGLIMQRSSVSVQPSHSQRLGSHPTVTVTNKSVVS